METELLRGQLGEDVESLAEGLGVVVLFHLAEDFVDFVFVRRHNKNIITHLLSTFKQTPINQI